MTSRPVWRRADIALAGLVTVALLAVTLALAMSGRGLQATLALAVAVCHRTLGETLAHSADIGRLSLLVPLAIGLGLGFLEGFRSAAGTRRWLLPLSILSCEPTGRLKRLSQRIQVPGPVMLVDLARPLAFTTGVLRPAIWLSSGLLDTLDDDELEAVLRHEAHHVMARDPLKILIVRCLSRALFFVPVARDLSDAYGAAKETAADAHATRAMGDPLPLVRALRKLLTAGWVPVPGAAISGERGIVEVRLHALLDPAHALPLFAVKRLGLSLLLFALLLGVLISPAAGHSPSVSECAPVASGMSSLA